MKDKAFEDRARAGKEKKNHTRNRDPRERGQQWGGQERQGHGSAITTVRQLFNVYISRLCRTLNALPYPLKPRCESVIFQRSTHYISPGTGGLEKINR